MTTYNTKIAIPEEILLFFRYILNNFISSELRTKIKFHENEILAETFKREWVEIFRSKASKSFELSVLKENLLVVTTDTHSVFTTRTVKVKNEWTTKTTEKKVKNANFGLNFKYSSGFFEVSIEDYEILEESATISYIEQLSEIFKKIEKSFKKYSKNLFLVHFFDTLHSRRLINVDGSVAVNMSRIYKNSCIHFPMFKNLRKEDQLKVLNNAIIGAIKKDIHYLALRMAYSILNTEGIKTFVCYNHNSDKVITYHKERIYFGHYYDDVIKKNVINKNEIRFVTHSTEHYETSFDPFFMKDRLIVDPNKNLTRLMLMA